MRKVVLFFLLIGPIVFSQPKINAVAFGNFAFAADAYAGSDVYGFHYFIKDNIFIKTDGKKNLEYKKIALGKITRADIENPLLIVLFYESFNTVVLLDNQLNEVRQIDFSTLETPIVAHAAGMAARNQLWIYDSLSQQIGLYDYLKNTWQSITTPLKETFNAYQSDFNTFQWTDAKSGWFATDIFGKIQTLGKTPDYDRIRFVSGTRFFFSKDGKLYVKDLKDNIVYSVSGIDNSLKNFYFKDQILSIFTGSGITNYKINLP